MISKKSTIKKRLFICTHERPDRECCFTKGSPELIAILKEDLKKNNMRDKYKVTKSGCIGNCSQGIAGLLYPENIELTGITLQSKEDLKKMLLKD